MTRDPAGVCPACGGPCTSVGSAPRSISAVKYAPAPGWLERSNGDGSQRPADFPWPV